MGKVKILPETVKDPISLIGRRAGHCWGADVSNPAANYIRGIECIENNHGRTLEFPDVHATLEGYSARVIREWYTHIGGAPTRLQASTRYIDYRNFPYVTPHSVLEIPKAKEVYERIMEQISSGITELVSLGVPREDAAMPLPLAMETVEVDKRNLRNLIDMSRNRMCNRAYWEFRELFDDYLKALSEYSEEWKWLVDTQMMPKCELFGYCTEKYSCGMMPRKNAN